MKVKDEIKQIAVHEAKSAYHKARLVGAVSEKGLKFMANKGKFMLRYVKELRNKE